MYVCVSMSEYVFRYVCGKNCGCSCCTGNHTKVSLAPDIKVLGVPFIIQFPVTKVKALRNVSSEAASADVAAICKERRAAVSSKNVLAPICLHINAIKL